MQINEVTSNQRRARKKAYALKTMAKYRKAAELGMDPAKVNQRRNEPTPVKEDGVIVPGVNTTVDVKPGETERQAAKFFGHNKPIKQKKYKSDAHTLYNLGLVNENKVIAWEKVVKQSDPLTVLDKVSSRTDNSVFPVRMYDGSTIGVTPDTARRIVDVYDEIASDDMKKKIKWFLRTKNGFKELAQLVGGRFTASKVAKALGEDVAKLVESAYASRKK